jgi:P4 family phage/plasmid primase-like protien
MPDTAASSSGTTAVLLETARAYFDAGLCPMPRILGGMQPAYIAPTGEVLPISWGEYKIQRPDWPTIEMWFAYSDLQTVGVVLLTGAHAQPRAQQAAFLQILDIETAETFDAFREELLFLGHGPVLDRCVIEQTPGGGAHLGFLCTTIADKQKVALARRQDGKVLIELLQHQPCTVAPTAIRCKVEHPEGATYRLLQGSWAHPLEISPAQRQTLLTIAKLYTEVPEHTAREPHGSAAAGAAGTRPGDRLNEQADIDWWQDLLCRHGWRDVSRPGLVSRGIYYFQRPGKVGREPSATYGATGSSFYVFSSNALPFEAETAYSPFAAYALLEHGGDFARAAKALALEYGMDGTQEAHRRQNGQGPPRPHTLPIPYGDVWNAQALQRAYGEQVRYCAPLGGWLLWSGTHWEKDETEQIMTLARQTLTSCLVDAAQAKDTDRLQHISRCFTHSKLTAMIAQASSLPGIAVKPTLFDQDPWLLNCTNGTLDLRTGTLRPHDPEDYLTKGIPLAYDQTAPCPLWEQFLWRVMGGSQGTDSLDMNAGTLEDRTAADQRATAMIAFLQRAVGYSLTGSTREQCLFILYGITKTGKSTFIATLRALLGPYGQQADMASFLHKDRDEVRNDLADLVGSRLVCALETQEGRRLAESLIKQMTGGVDLIKARFLFHEHFTYKPQFKIFLGTNHKPVIRDTDSAIWERIRLVPFTVQIPKAERDKTLDERLQQELPGILAWAVRGCLDWQRLGELQEPQPVVEATTGYQKEMDAMGRFLEECCILSAQVRVKVGDLYAAYKKWCEDSGEPPLTLTKFGYRLDEQGFAKVHSGGVWRLGIGLYRATK